MTNFGWTPGSASSSAEYWSKWNSEGAACPDVPEQKEISVQSLNELSETLKGGRTYTGIRIFLEIFVCFEEQDIFHIIIILLFHVLHTSLIILSLSTLSVSKRSSHKCKTYSSATSDDWDRRAGDSSGWGSLIWLLIKDIVTNIIHTLQQHQTTGTECLFWKAPVMNNVLKLVSLKS